MNDMVIVALGDDSLRAVVKQTLQEMNLDIREVSQGPQAIKDVAALKPALVIVDDTLPYLSGYQFSRLLKFGFRLDIPLIMIISSEQKMDQFWSTSCGADFCLSRPVNQEELKKIVQETIKGRRVQRFFFRPPLIVGRNVSDLDIMKMANDLLDRHLFQEKVLNELKSLNRQVDSVRDLVSAMMPILNSLFPFRVAAVFLYYETRASLLASTMEEIGQARIDSLYSYLLSYVRDKENLDLSVDDIPLTLLGPAMLGPVANVDDFDEQDISVFSGRGLRNVTCCLIFDGLNLESYPEEDARTFHLILQQALETIEEKVVFEKSVPFSIIDTVNHQANRSFLLKILAQNMEQARRFQTSLTLIGLSLENYPHLAGSLSRKDEFRLWQNISATLLNAVRKMDVVARISEHQFILVLLKASAEQARTVYQRVKTLLEDLPLPNEPIRVQGGFWPYDSSLGLLAEEYLLTACAQIFRSGSEEPRDAMMMTDIENEDRQIGLESEPVGSEPEHARSEAEPVGSEVEHAFR
ncbi:MAG: response regulator [bacterium]